MKLCEWPTALLSLIYPPHCAGCGSALAERRPPYLCDECIEAVRGVPEPICRKCGHPLGPYASVLDDCLNCRPRRLMFTRATAATTYEGVVREMIHKLKYQRKNYYVDPLGELLVKHAAGALLPGEIDVVMPVPLHPAKRRERGFNQSELLARRVSVEFGLPLDAASLIRTVPTQSQTYLQGSRRMENVRGAFSLTSDRSMAGKHVLLVDDVMTTGATASECARVLRRAKVSTVRVITVAR